MLPEKESGPRCPEQEGPDSFPTSSVRESVRPRLPEVLQVLRYFARYAR